MSTNDLKTMMPRMLELRAKAYVDPGLDAPQHILASLHTVANGAQQELEQMERELPEVIERTAVAAFVVGPGAAKFADIANDEGAIVIRADDPYLLIADVLETSFMGKRVFLAHNTFALLEGLRQVQFKLNISYMPSPNTTSLLNRSFANFDEVVQAVRQVIRDTVGDELVLGWIRNALRKEVVATEYDGAVVPCVIIGLTEDEVAGIGGRLFGGRTTQVKTTEHPSPNDFAITMKSLAKLKPKK